MLTYSQYDLEKIANHVMLEKGFIIDFPTTVIDELNQITDPAPCLPSSSIKDLRHLLWMSIDAEDTFDLDQVTFAEELSPDQVKIYVAIADVAVLVEKGSALDEQAKSNTTSVYTPMKIFPMLPEKLSINYTSLNANEDRRSIVVEMIVEKDGAINTFDIYQAHIHNYAKLSFEAVGAWLAHQTSVPDSVSRVNGMTEQVKLQERVARTIRQYRQQQGALAFKTIEASPVVVDGKIVELEDPVYNRARDIIENFMISANATVTRFLSEKKMPVLRRIVRTPKRWSRIVEIAENCGEKLPDTPDVKSLGAFLRKRRQADPHQFPDLSLAVIKLLGRGEYYFNLPGEPVEGHFDLAFKDYAHTTAPNRRFADLVIQRVLKSLFEETALPYDHAQLTAIAKHCTIKEDDATKVQRSVNKSASAIILSPRINESFNAIVTGASSKGTWVRLTHPSIEGKLIQGFEGVDVGDRLTVKLVSVNVAKGFIDFVTETR